MPFVNPRCFNAYFKIVIFDEMRKYEIRIPMTSSSAPKGVIDVSLSSKEWLRYLHVSHLECGM